MNNTKSENRETRRGKASDILTREMMTNMALRKRNATKMMTIEHNHLQATRNPKTTLKKIREGNAKTQLPKFQGSEKGCMKNRVTKKTAKAKKKRNGRQEQERQGMHANIPS